MSSSKKKGSRAAAYADAAPEQKKPEKFRFGEAFEDICLRRGWSPADALIEIYEEAQRVAEECGASPFDALKLQMEAVKLGCNKVYANKSETRTTIAGDEKAPLVSVIKLAPLE